MLRKIAITASSAMLLSASPAFADAIILDPSKVGTSFSLAYDGFTDGTAIAGLTGEATFTLTGVSGTSYTFDYLVDNTSSGGVDSRVSSFAFDTNPDISSATSTGTFNYTVLDSNYPNGIGNVDVCFKGGDSNSCGGNSGGVSTGSTGTGTLSLNFSQPVSSLTLDNFFVRYQSITGVSGVTSASGTGTITSSSGGSTSGGTSVPEPGMLGLFGLGLVAVALSRRRSRQPKLSSAFS